MKKRLDYIDALRGFAVLGVLLTHTMNPLVSTANHFIGNIISNGARGVQLFFIISSFTLFLSLENKKKERHATRNYFIRRFFRIAPLFYIAIIVYLFIHGTGPRYWLGDAPKITSWNIAGTALFVNGWNPHWFNSIMDINWTVAVEMSFYLVVPFLFSRIKNLFDSVLLLTVSGTLLVFLNPFLSAHNPIGSLELWTNFINLWLPNQFPVFVLGIVLYFLIFPERSVKNESKKRNNVLMALVLFSAVGFLYYEQLPAINPFALIFFGLAYGLAKNPIKLLVNKFTIYLGKISYSVYLTHLIALSMALKFKPFVDLLIIDHQPVTYIIIFLLALLFAMIISTITYYFIEKPGIIFGNKLIEKMERGDPIYFIELLKRLKWNRSVSKIDQETW